MRKVVLSMYILIYDYEKDGTVSIGIEEEFEYWRMAKATWDYLKRIDGYSNFTIASTER